MYFNKEIETMPLKKMRELQLERLKWSDRPRVQEQRLLPEEIRRRRVPPGPVQVPGRHEAGPLPHQAGHAGQLSLRALRGADGEGRAGALVVRHHRQRHGGGLHQEGRRGLRRGGGALPGRLRRDREGRDPGRLRLRPLHRRPGAPLRRGEARRADRADLRRQHRAPAHADQGLRHHHARLHAVLSC